MSPDLTSLDEEVVWQGRLLQLRAIRPEDEARHHDFLEHLTPEDLRLRFFFSRRKIPAQEVAHMVRIDYSHEMAFIALDTPPVGPSHTLGVARAFVDAGNLEAEFAIIVRSELHGKGLGTLLLRKLMRYLQARGTRRVVCDVLRENTPMRNLAALLGFHVEASLQVDSTLHYVRDLQGPR